MNIAHTCEPVFQWSFSLFLCVLFVVHQLASLVCVAHRQSVVCCVVIYKDLFCDERPQTARVARSRVAQNSVSQSERSRVARNLANASIS